LNPQSST